MTKSDLIERLTSKHFNLSVKEIEESVKETLLLMSDSLANGERIEVRGFGSFSLHYRAPRIGRNPKQEIRSNLAENMSLTLNLANH